MATNAEYPSLRLRPGRISVIAGMIVLMALGAGFLGGHLSVERSTTTSPAHVAVPDLLGMPSQLAINTVEDAGLRGSIALRFNKSTPQNVVISQHPLAGSRIKKGTVVQIVVSAGPVLSGSK